MLNKKGSNFNSAAQTEGFSKQEPSEESMFDKLGDLLSSAIDSGFIFSQDSTQKETDAEASPAEESTETSIKNEKSTVQKTVLTEEEKNAFNFLGLSEDSDYETAKRAYREKLMYYHPDRRNDNPTLQKVAKEKTERLLREWKTVENFFISKSGRMN